MDDVRHTYRSFIPVFSARVMALFFLAALLLLGIPYARAADVYGRVYDTMRSKMYPGAVIEFAGRRVEADAAAQFWLRDIRPGSYLVRIVVPGRDVMGRVFVMEGRPTNIVNLDLARIDPPHEDDAY